MDKSLNEDYNEIRSWVKGLSDDPEIKKLLTKVAKEFGYDEVYPMLMNSIDVVLQFIFLKTLSGNDYFGIPEKNTLRDFTEIGDLLIWLDIGYDWDDIYYKKLSKEEFQRLINDIEILCDTQSVFKRFGWTLAMANIFYYRNFSDNIKLKMVSMLMGFIRLYVDNKNYWLKIAIEFIENSLWKEVYQKEREINGPRE